MRSILLIALLLLPAEIHAAGRRRVAPVLPDDIVISFDSQAPLLDVGTVHHGTVTKTIGVRLTHRSGATGFARLRASVAGDGRAAVRVDGLTLTSVPRLVEARAAVGGTGRHRIEIVVPASAPEGALATSIVWEAEDIQ